MAFIHDLLRKELIDAINKGNADLDKVQWSSLFNTIGYYNIAEELFDKINDKWIKKVFVAYIKKEWMDYSGKEIICRGDEKKIKWFLGYGISQFVCVERRIKTKFPRYKILFTEYEIGRLNRQRVDYYLKLKIEETHYFVIEMKKELKRMRNEISDIIRRLPSGPQELRELHTQGRCMSEEQQETSERLCDEPGD